MNKTGKKIIVLWVIVIGFQKLCSANGLQTGSGGDLNSVVLGIALLSLFVSLGTLVFLLFVRRQNKVDMVNTTEDMHLAIDSLKTTLGKDIKNVRKEINRNYRRDNPRPNHPQQSGETNTDKVTEQNTDRPAPNRRLPHKKHYSRGRSFQPRNPESENTATE